jgi:nucleoside-diphosphate-sugar epimerase
VNLKALDLVKSDCTSVLKERAPALNALKGDTITVLGGTGFVGSWLAELVTTLNDEYNFGTQLVLISRGVDHFKKLRPHLANRKDVQLIKSDVRHTSEIPKNTQWLIHAAANPDNRFHSTYPVETMTVIGNGTESILRAVDRCSNFKILQYLSSGLVYGPQPLDLDRVPETYSGMASLNSVSGIYAEAKRYAEMLCAGFRSQLRIPTTVARPFAFIGPYQSLTGPWAINNFIHDSISGKSIRVLGDGKTVRSYMYPSDMAYWLLRMLTGAQSGSQYNVGSPDSIELGKLAEMISQGFAPRPDILFSVGSGGVANRSRFVPDVTSAAETFDLSITVPLAAAIQRTIEWNRLTEL